MRFTGTLLALLAALSGAAAAQSAQHGATVSIPTVLKLKLDHTDDSVSLTQAIAVTVENGAYEITPGSNELQVFSNTPWQLSISYRPDSERDAEAQLRWQHEGDGWSRLTGSPQIVDEGGSTGGWQSHVVDYDLDGVVPADGVYRGTITYVLAQP
jgi:hypothetical protein